MTEHLFLFQEVEIPTIPVKEEKPMAVYKLRRESKDIGPAASLEKVSEFNKECDACISLTNFTISLTHLFFQGSAAPSKPIPAWKTKT